MTQLDYLTKMANAVIDEDTGVSMEYMHIIKLPNHIPVWFKSFANEVYQLSQGVGVRMEVTDTIVSAPQQYT